jgi:uncharacterized phage infection (PIP) family protein YhgE
MSDDDDKTNNEPSIITRESNPNPADTTATKTPSASKGGKGGGRDGGGGEPPDDDEKKEAELELRQINEEMRSLMVEMENTAEHLHMGSAFQGKMDRLIKLKEKAVLLQRISGITIPELTSNLRTLDAKMHDHSEAIYAFRLKNPNAVEYDGIWYKDTYDMLEQMAANVDQELQTDRETDNFFDGIFGKRKKWSDAEARHNLESDIEAYNEYEDSVNAEIDITLGRAKRKDDKAAEKEGALHKHFTSRKYVAEDASYEDVCDKKAHFENNPEAAEAAGYTADEAQKCDKLQSCAAHLRAGAQAQRDKLPALVEESERLASDRADKFKETGNPAYAPRTQEHREAAIDKIEAQCETQEQRECVKAAREELRAREVDVQRDKVVEVAEKKEQNIEKKELSAADQRFMDAFKEKAEEFKIELDEKCNDFPSVKARFDEELEKNPELKDKPGFEATYNRLSKKCEQDKPPLSKDISPGTFAPDNTPSPGGSGPKGPSR